MSGLFSDDEEAPQVPFTEYNVNRAAPNANFAPINFTSIMDDVAGEEFTFIRGLDGQRYLQFNRQIEDLQNQLDNTKVGIFSDYDVQNEVRQKRANLESKINNLSTQRDAARNDVDENGLRPGQVRMSSRSTRDRIPLDAPLNLNAIDTNLPNVDNIRNNELAPVDNIRSFELPNVGNLRDFNMRYAAMVATLTGELRNLGNSINVMQMTAPELIPQVAYIVNPYKEATQRAMDKGFDIYQNGLDKKLTQMGLNNSSTALGSQIALARDRVDAEINNALQTAQLGHGIKKDVIAGQFQLGQQIVQEGTIELNRYISESQNELTARSQDLGREQLVQQRGAEQGRLNLQRDTTMSQLNQQRSLNQANLNLQRDTAMSQLNQQRGFNQANLNMSQEQLRANTELERRRIAAQVAISRNPMNSILGYNAQSSQLGLNAIQGDNQAQNAQNMTQIGNQQAQTQRFQVNQAAQSDPMGQLINTGVGAGIGALGGSLGTMAGFRLGGMSADQASNALGGNKRLN